MSFKKTLLLILGICLITTPVFAGYKANTYASWVSVTGNTTITFPLPSRAIWVHNGSAIDICVSLRGDTIDADCMVGSPNSTFQLNGTADVHFDDYISESISFRSATGVAASPVSVIVTF